MSLRARINKALFASFVGWIAAFAASLPFQVIEAIRVSGFTLYTALALFLWLPFTLLVSFYFCSFFFLPLAWLLPASWILRHLRLWIFCNAAFGVLLPAIRLHVWTVLYRDGVSVINFFMWAIFAATFFFTTTALYAKSLRASLPAA
jgi:hypothetical protein